jgi:ribosomal protein S26
MKMKISKVKNKTSTKNRKDLGEVGVQAKYIFTRIAKVKYLLCFIIPLNIIHLQPKKYLKLSIPYLLSLSTTY